MVPSSPFATATRFFAQNILSGAVVVEEDPAAASAHHHRHHHRCRKELLSMWELPCPAQLPSMVAASTRIDHFEDQFELPFEDSASRVLASLTNALPSTSKPSFLEKKTIDFRTNARSFRPFSSFQWRRRDIAESQTLGHKNVMASLPSASLSCREEDNQLEVEHPSANQLLSHPLAMLSYVPRDLALFLAGAVAGAAAKTVTAPLDRVKLLMQVHGMQSAQGNASRGLGFLEATLKIGKEEGLQGYWKGNFPQVIRVIPYSAVQLFAYEVYKNLFKGENKELSVASRLAAGACAGMTSTLVTYPLDVLRLRLAVDPACKSMLQVASTMLREEGVSSFYRGLGPSLIGIAPYIALNFCAFDL